MLLRKKYILVVASTLLLALVFFGVKTLHHEWRIAYTILFQKTYYKVNLLDLQLKNIFEGIYRPLVAGREKGLPERRLYISQKAQNALMKDLPANTKKWQRAYLIYPDGKLRRVKARHRGDNPVNWAFHKKSWRVKLQKDRLIDNTRVFNFIVPQEKNHSRNYFPYYMGRMAGVLSPRVNLVELFINDKPQGIYYEREHIDENFLRGNRLMPVNIYKGEQTNRELQITIANDLFDNPGLWSKVSAFNQLPENNFSDLEYVLDLIRQAGTSDSSLIRLKRVARYEDWARFSAFQTIVQSWHNDISANMRIVSDPWKGTIRPVVHDTLSLHPLSYKRAKTFDIIFGSGYDNPLLSIYHGSSDFLAEKYRMLYGFVKDGLILKAVQHFEEIYPAMERSFSRDYFRYEKIYSNDYLAHPVNVNYMLGLTEKEGMKAEWEQMVVILRWFQKTLREELETPPPARWLNREDSIGLIIDGAVPLNRVTLEFSQGDQLPRSVAWDADGDGRLSGKDISIPFRTQGSQLELDAVWTANRVTSSPDMSDPKNPVTSFYGVDFLTIPTQFQLVADTKLVPVSVRGANFLTGEMFLLASGGEPGNTPSRRNVPVVEKTPDPIEVWSGNRVIEGNDLVDRPVRILSGTTLRLGAGASLIFRNRVEIEGTREAPVRIVSDVPEEPWGTVALHGPDTAGSVLSHLTIENGSGALIGNIRYIGMLSVHEARDVEFKNLTLRKNRKFDDMMHVVYSEDIRLRDCVFEGAFSDGLDVDISTVRIEGCRMSGSGNDAIDLMDSKALIMASEISHSGDKGVSVGEASEAVIYNSHLHHNIIGVESKDSSVAHIINSTLVENKRQVNAYKKNWRYGSGGRVMADKSVFVSADNSIKGDKKSNINVYDSTFSPSFGEKDKQVFIDSLSDESRERKAASTDYQPVTAKALQVWGIKGDSDRRGVLQ